MNSLRISVTWFAFGAAIGIAMLLQPVIAPVLPKEAGDRLVYVFKRGIAYAGGKASAIELAGQRDGLIIKDLSFFKDMNGRQIGFSIDRMVLDKVQTDRLIDLYLGRDTEERGDEMASGYFAGSLLFEGFEVRTGQDILSIKSMVFKNAGTVDYRQWFDPKTFRNGSYASVLAFLMLAGTAETASAREIFFRNHSTVPISASIDGIDAVSLAAGQVANIQVRNAVAQWRLGNGVAMRSVVIRTFNAREIVSAAAGYDNNIAAPEALIFDLAEFKDFSLHTPDIEILRIGQGTVGTYTQLGRIPVSARLSLEDMSLEVDALEMKPIRDYLSDSGIGAIAADISLAYIFDRNTGHVTIQDGVIVAPELAAIDLTAELAGINPSWNAISDFLSGLKHSQIVAAQARIEDHSIVSRVSQKWVRDTKRRPQDLVTWIIASEAGEDLKASRIATAVEALRNFVGAPDALTISLAPEEPVPFGAVFGGIPPEKVFEVLAVDIAVEDRGTGQLAPN